MRMKQVVGTGILLSLLGLLPAVSIAQPLAAGKDKFLGAATSGNIWSGLATYWNQVTPGNDGKWGITEIIQGQLGFVTLDKIYNYAVDRGLPFKEHALVWGNQQPSWIAFLDSAQQRAAVENWIRRLGERYPEMAFVDVVNEPFHAPPVYMNALGGSGATGWDWVITAFQLARQYCAPGAKLLLNEYNIIQDNTVTTNYINLITLLKNRGLIDGIGVQGHYFEFRSDSADPNHYVYSRTTLSANLDRLAATGLPIYITEFDIDEPDDAIQLSQYQIYFPLLWNHPGVKGITLWGYIQNDVWSAHPNTYVIRTNGSERPALQWLRSFLTAGSYQSAQSGNWNDPATWARYTGSTWVTPAPNVPSFTERPVTILNGHTVTVAVPAMTAGLTIAAGGSLVVNSGTQITVNRGSPTPVGLSISGSLLNHGEVVSDTLPTILYASGGRYVHARDAGTIPEARWAPGSICQVDSVAATPPANLLQGFSNIVWNCPGQGIDVTLGWHRASISGGLTIQNTGTGRVQICAPAAGVSDTVDIAGNVVQSGGQFAANGSNDPGSAVLVNHSGNVNVTGGDFSISRGTQGGTGTTTWNLLSGNFTMSGATSGNATTTPDGAKFVFARTGNQTLSLGAGNAISSLPIEVRSGATLGMGTSVLTGSGSFLLAPGATLECGNPGGLDSALRITGMKSLSGTANYTFNGSSPQVTGALLPPSVANLSVNNAAGVTLSGSVVVNGTFALQRGAIASGANTLSYGAAGTLLYSGSTAQSTSDGEFPVIGGPRNLSITNIRGVTLHAPRGVGGSAYLGGKLLLGDNDFTAGSVTIPNIVYYAVTQGTGALRIPTSSPSRFYPIGTKTGYAPVTLTGGVATDTLGVSAVDDSAAAPYGGRAMVRWHVSGSPAGAMLDTARFGWSFALEDDALMSDRAANALLYSIAPGDTAEAGYGPYVSQLSTNPYSLARAGVVVPGVFAVGAFGNPAAPPRQPTPVSPVGSLNEPRNPIMLWRCATSSVASYHVVVATDSNFVSMVAETTVVDATVRLAPLAAHATFYWRVRASNGNGAGAYSVTAWFTTGDAIVDVKDHPALPAEFALHQNYPNPFNPTTRIDYQLPVACDVRLIVYDIIGREVATLVAGRQEAGFYSVSVQGNRLSSGVYLYRLSTEGFTAVKRFVLLK